MKSSLARESPCVPYRLQGQSVTRYQSCTVDPRPARVVHCPDLNACLVNEGRKEHVDCNAVHFGYAIPINVVPLPDDPSLAELVLDSGSDLTPETVSYLINHHPQLRKEEEGNTAPQEEDTGMATTANHHNSKFSTTEPEEDIAAIAKQISDHAEAIYQTWKSRGLAPTEILNCHTNMTAADKFGSALTPSQTSGGTPSSSSPVVDLLSSPTSLNTNNLEKFVNNFVVEDKARQQQKAKTLPSSIQFALEKFEKKSNPLRNGASSAPRAAAKQANEPVLKIYPKPTSNFPTKPQSPTVGLSKYIMMDTIETTFPEDYAPQKTKKTEEIKSRTPVPATATAAAAAVTTTTTTGSSGLTTWPLKNKNISSGVNEPIRKTVSNEPKTMPVDTSKYNTLPNKFSSNEYLDEVAKEEERLINALKTGIIIAEDPTSKRNDSKASGLLQKKNLSMQKKVNEPQKSSVNLLSSPSSPSTGSADVVDFKSRPNNNNNISSSSSSVNSNVVEEKTDVSRVIKKLESSTKRTPTPIVSSGSSSRNNTSSVPHPELTGAQRMHLRSSAANGLANHANNPVRPFLTRGSVAERVLIFEKCPTELMMEKRVKSGAGSGTGGTPSWRSTSSDVHSKTQTYSRDSLSSQKSGGPPPHTTLQRHAKANRSVLIPRFYYPHGKPSNQTQLEVTLEAIRQVFQTFPNQQATREKFGAITKACGCPLYWKAPLFIACGGEKLGYVELNTFLDYWRNLCTTCHDPASKFIRIVTRSSSRNYILPEDLMPLVQDVVDTHPGLTFLKEAAEFHSRYVHTVISRIYYCVNQSWSGQITLPELRKSDFLQVVQLLETEDDINQVTQYFSYEHFYVIYCKFWELDRDHDLFIDKNDLAQHSDHEFKALIRRASLTANKRILTSLSIRLIDRIFSGTVTRGKTSSGQQSQLNGSPDAKMSYTEFVWFLLAEEDKQHPRAIEYWFRCMDLDGDGYLSMYELEYFYDEQLQRMSAIGIECLPFEDCLCQMLDMIRPTVPGKISLSDLKRCKMTPIFFDTFFNLEKYLDHEHRDPFASQRDHDTEMSDWDRYAAEEYELLVAEEGGNDNQEEILYDDRDDEEDILSPNLDHILSTQFISNNVCGDSSDKKRHNGLPEGQDWSQPSLTVTYYDDEDEENSPSSSSDSADYAADSDECSF